MVVLEYRIGIMSCFILEEKLYPFGGLEATGGNIVKVMSLGENASVGVIW